MPNKQFEIIMDQYASLMSAVDEKCAEVFASIPEIPCKNKCIECCKQLFPLSFAEAFYISEGAKKMNRTLRRQLAKKADKINEKLLKQNPLQFEKQGVDRKTALNTHGQFAQFLHEFKIDCPALVENEKGACACYEFRNHDCRSMGFSFDKSANSIVGCFRFDALKNLAPKLMPFNYLYPEKMRLDQELIREVTDGLFTPNIFYLTTMCTPLIKDHSAVDWIKFFSQKGAPEKSDENKYWVTIDI